MNEFDCLKIENQLCFPLYVVAKEIIKKYKPFLDKYDLTYTQYITMLVLWENNNINVKTLGEKLYLDSGTLTPLLKKLENKGYIERRKYKDDERNLVVSLTKSGLSLRNECKTIPSEVGKCINLTEKETIELYTLLYKLINNINN